MAKELTFTLTGAMYASAPIKLERKKNYGWSNLVATDKEGVICNTAYLLPDDCKEERSLVATLARDDKHAKLQY